MIARRSMKIIYSDEWIRQYSPQTEPPKQSQLTAGLNIEPVNGGLHFSMMW